MRAARGRLERDQTGREVTDSNTVVIDWRGNSGGGAVGVAVVDPIITIIEVTVDPTTRITVERSTRCRLISAVAIAGLALEVAADRRHLWCHRHCRIGSTWWSP
jgi:hypothetical protein